MLALFEKYSQTSEERKHKIHPLLINKSAYLVFDKIAKYLAEEGYANLTLNKNFLEIYCTDYGFEITVIVSSEDEATALVNASVYGEKKRGRTRSRLKKFILEIDRLFV
ncbi:MAG: hypothetical protein ACOX3K_02100 [Bacilli bacterium]|jgi:hypothetical protein